ncbi:hypothetical protein EDB85DRAFT_1890371 [Lactarius pseudohatsudake]|nr:hypothetical protein EDB85DRAFT_1890371 [Lactarius pseudohatsudake]
MVEQKGRPYLWQRHGVSVTQTTNKWKRLDSFKGMVTKADYLECGWSVEKQGHAASCEPSDAVFSPAAPSYRWLIRWAVGDLFPRSGSEGGGEVTVDTTWFSFLLSLTPLPPPPNIPLWPLGPWAPEPRVPSRPLKAQGSWSLRRAYPCYRDCPLCLLGNSQAAPSYRWLIQWAVGDLLPRSGSGGGGGDHDVPTTSAQRRPGPLKGAGVCATRAHVTGAASLAIRSSYFLDGEHVMTTAMRKSICPYSTLPFRSYCAGT